MICNNNYITNLSSIHLSSAETSLLAKGLNFIPTCCDLTQKELLDSFDDFVTRLRASTTYREPHKRDNKQGLEFPHRRVTEHLPIHQSPQIEGTLNQMKLTLTKLKKTEYQKPNLTKEERKALKTTKAW